MEISSHIFSCCHFCQPVRLLLKKAAILSFVVISAGISHVKVFAQLPEYSNDISNYSAFPTSNGYAGMNTNGFSTEGYGWQSAANTFPSSFSSEWSPSGLELHNEAKKVNQSRIPTVQRGRDEISGTQFIFTDVLKNAYSSGNFGIERANRFSQELTTSVEYTRPALEQFLETLPVVPGTSTVCYPQSAEDILQRCSKARDYGGEVYIPINKVEDPTVQNLGKVFLDRQDKSWYEAMKTLKRQTNLKIIGMLLGPPDHAFLFKLLSSNHRSFDGLFVDWEYGSGACWNKLEKSPPENNWSWFISDKVRYLMRGQDSSTCITSEGIPSSNLDFLRSAYKDPPIQDFIIPMFPCYGGSEWKCFSAISERVSEACDPNKQRYAFSPYDMTSLATLKYFVRTCEKIFGRSPSFDLVQIV